MRRRALSVLLLLLLSSVLSGACAGGPPPEKRPPEITAESIPEDLNEEWVEVPPEGGAPATDAEHSYWRFARSEPKELEIVEQQVEGDRATFVIDLRTRTSPRSEQRGHVKKLAGRLRLHYELESGLALRRWEIVRIENISFAYVKE